MPLVDKLLILAMAVQAILAIFILVRLGLERVPRVARGEVSVSEVAVDRSGWHLKAKLLSNSFDSQFQLPVLFGFGVLIFLHIGIAGWVEVILAWTFVVLRWVHATLHTTTNPLYPRFFVFSAGLAVLALFWLWLVVRILLVPST